MAERLTRSVLNTMEGYWHGTQYSDQRVSLAPGDTWNVPGTFSQIVIDADAELVLKFGWTQSSTQVLVAIDQMLVMTGPLTGAFIRNDASVGAPNALVRVLTVS